MVALSGLPNDMRAVRKAAAAGNADAKLAIEVFCRSVRKAIGAYAWLLGGLDALVFTGGIGEHDVQSRAEILRGLESCGVVLDAAANEAGGDELRRVSGAEFRSGGLGGNRPGRSNDRSACRADGTRLMTEQQEEL